MQQIITLSPWQLGKEYVHTIEHYVSQMEGAVVQWQSDMPKEAPLNLLPNNKSGVFLFADNQLKAIIWCEAEAPILPIDNIITSQITPPFRLDELGQNIVKICNNIWKSDDDKGIIELSNQVTLNTSRRQVICTQPSGKAEIIIELTEKETDLLRCLKICKKSGDKYISRETLLTKVWSYNVDIDTHTIETHIYRLRSKIAKANVALEIQSEDGGYFLSE